MVYEGNVVLRKSDQLEIDIGVLQERVLGALLFLWSINDIRKSITISHCAFSDDIAVVSSDECLKYIKSKFNLFKNI